MNKIRMNARNEHGQSRRDDVHVIATKHPWTGTRAGVQQA
jgi:hypothetical protein